ncbi:hypothetical protein AA0114_g5264 [Alternaria tenuissima]|uniref:CBM1 domain-containing protein n=1 Tax=Alternaria tenuissima TaxID=119927 RepID=A0A4Q4MIL3_9PLEO|nr:hypothetical protein AA0114_g5264 [Alternaria tenuissima]
MQITIVTLLSLAAFALAAPQPAPQRDLPPFCSSGGECAGWCGPNRTPYCELYPDSSGDRCVCSG